VLAAHNATHIFWMRILSPSYPLIRMREWLPFHPQALSYLRAPSIV
jgi:hypothetical protein